MDCEQVPLLPAWAVAWALDDPRKIPYLFVWKRPEDSSVREVVRVSAYSGLAGLRSSGPMEHGISFSPCYDLCRETGARPGFSFVPRRRDLWSIYVHAGRCNEPLRKPPLVRLFCARRSVVGEAQLLNHFANTRRECGTYTESNLDIPYGDSTISRISN